MKLKEKCIRYYRSLLIKNRKVTIISNNCWGGFMYQSCRLQYQSPFIGLFVWASDYIFLLEHFDDFLFSDAYFHFINKEQSKYASFIQETYPIGVLVSDNVGEVEIHFLHYTSREECITHWNRRVKRIDKNNMIVKFCDRDEATLELIERFDALPFNNKVCFTAKKYLFESTCQILEFENSQEVRDEWKFSEKYWSFIKHANLLVN